MQKRVIELISFSHQKIMQQIGKPHILADINNFVLLLSTTKWLLFLFSFFNFFIKKKNLLSFLLLLGNNIHSQSRRYIESN